MKKVLLLCGLLLLAFLAEAQYYGSLKKLDQRRGVNGIKLGAKNKSFSSLRLTLMTGNYDWYLNENENRQLGEANLKHVFYGFRNGKLQTLQITFEPKNYQAIYLFLRGEFGWPEKVERNYKQYLVWPGKKVILVLANNNFRFLFSDSEEAKAENWWPEK